MGVHGLTSYVASHKELWETVQLPFVNPRGNSSSSASSSSSSPSSSSSQQGAAPSNQSQQRHVAVDGFAVVYSLHRQLEWTYGGHYGKFKEAVTLFVEAFRKANCVLHVYMDGTAPAMKLETVKAREAQKIERVTTALKTVCVNDNASAASASTTTTITTTTTTTTNNNNNNNNSATNANNANSDAMDTSSSNENNSSSASSSSSSSSSSSQQPQQPVNLDKQVLPPMIAKAFAEVMHELNVDFRFCDAEADDVVGYMAKKNHAVALSNDSDFFIIDIPCGYCPLSAVNILPDRLVLELFRSASFANALKFDKSLLPLFASLAGNDYVDRELLKSFHGMLLRRFPQRGAGGRQHAVLQSLGAFLGTFKTDENAALEEAVKEIVDLCFAHSSQSSTTVNININNLVDTLALFGTRTQQECYGFVKDVLKKSMAQYRPTAAAVNSATQLTVAPPVTVTLDAKIVDRFRSARLSHVTMQMISCGHFWGHGLIEDTDIPEGVWQTSKPIRQVIYGILCGDSKTGVASSTAAIKEFTRQGQAFVESEALAVAKLSNGSTVPAYSGVSALSKQDKQGIFLALTGSNPACLDLPKDWASVAMTMTYLVKSKAVTQAQAVAILECLVRRSEWNEVTGHVTNSLPPQMTRLAAHLSGLWQTTIYSLIMLNELLDDTLAFPTTQNIFDGFAFSYFLQAEPPVKVVSLSEIVGEKNVANAVKTAVSHATEHGAAGLFNALLAVVLEQTVEGKWFEWTPTPLFITPSGEKATSSNANAPIHFHAHPPAGMIIGAGGVAIPIIRPGQSSFNNHSHHQQQQQQQQQHHHHHHHHHGHSHNNNNNNNNSNNAAPVPVVPVAAAAAAALTSSGSSGITAVVNAALTSAVLSNNAAAAAATTTTPAAPATGLYRPPHLQPGYVPSSDSNTPTPMQGILPTANVSPATAANTHNTHNNGIAPLTMPTTAVAGLMPTPPVTLLAPGLQPGLAGVAPRSVIQQGKKAVRTQQMSEKLQTNQPRLTKAQQLQQMVNTPVAPAKVKNSFALLNSEDGNDNDDDDDAENESEEGDN